MSIESAKACMERMKTDEAFAKKVAACKDQAARAALVKAEGFDFNGNEIKEAATQLTPEELSQVSAGMETPEGIIKRRGGDYPAFRDRPRLDRS